MFLNRLKFFLFPFNGIHGYVHVHNEYKYVNIRQIVNSYSLEKQKYLPREIMQYFFNHFEFLLCKHCNLNCKSCTAMSPLYRLSPEIYDIEQFKSDVLDLKRIIPKDRNIYFGLVGGEPFLLKELEQYVIFLRKNFKNSFISITTNGTKILGKDVSFLRKNRCFVFISPYPCVDTKKVLTFLKKEKVQCNTTVKAGEFNTRVIPLDPRGCQNKDIAFSTCFFKCNEIFNGYFCPCFYPFVIKKHAQDLSN